MGFSSQQGQPQQPPAMLQQPQQAGMMPLRPQQQPAGYMGQIRPNTNYMQVRSGPAGQGWRCFCCVSHVTNIKHLGKVAGDWIP